MPCGGRTLYDKLVDAHAVRELDDAGHLLLYVDRLVLNEYTSPQAFAALRAAKRVAWRPGAALAVVDHVNPTAAPPQAPPLDPEGARQIGALRENCRDFCIELYDLGDPRNGIEHVVAAEQGLALPGMVVAGGDSHTTTYGAFGALGFGIGTSEIEHVLATQTIVYRRLRTMRVGLVGSAGSGVTAKDLVMAVVTRLGASGATGFAIEFVGEAVSALSVEGRMTLCNMAVEAGARGALVAPDAAVLRYLDGRPKAPAGALWRRATNAWAGLRSDPDAVFDAEATIDAAGIAPLVTWGTSPDMALPVSASVPDPEDEPDPARRAAMRRALDYMGLTPGAKLTEVPITHAFIGSCTNARIEDLRDAAALLRGRRAAPGVRAIVVPGSLAVRREAEAEGLDRIFTAAGFEWRGTGCSLCLAMNGDALRPGERCASSTNRNFEGRQGAGGRTHLMSPAMVAAAAVTGRLADSRALDRLTAEPVR
jgi:3-isopropylmalate/(R)-2-methylmalate dehydratase large subunit